MSSEQSQIKENDEQIKENDEPMVEELTDSLAEMDSPVEETFGEPVEEESIERAQATIKEYWEQILRLKAEIENNRKRSLRDVENAHKFALQKFTESLLPIVDSLEMGQKAAQAENANLESIVEGNELTMEMFVQVLEKHGLRQIDPVGEKFDPEQHQAISMVEDEKVESNTVVNVMQKGFLLNDRLVRPAMVVVSK